jgi:hypothetical protein
MTNPFKDLSLAPHSKQIAWPVRELQLMRVAPEESTVPADAYVVSDRELEYDTVAQFGEYTIYRTNGGNR